MVPSSDKPFICEYRFDKKTGPEKETYILQPSPRQQRHTKIPVLPVSPDKRRSEKVGA